MFLPELPGLRLAIDEHAQHKDVYEHTLTVVRNAIGLEADGPDLVLRLAALMHDVGKPATKAVGPDGRVSFHHHEVVGARLTRQRLKALRFPKDVIAEVSELVALHLRFYGYGRGEWTDSAVRRYVTDAGPLLARLHFYGYPYDFVPRRPYTLWMMADYGGGAATGTLCYNEDALPAEYHGNLFLADFAKRNVLRVRVERDGATYKAVVARGPVHRRRRRLPAGRDRVSPDGLSMYMCDWQHVDTKETVEVGRLLKLTYAGASAAPPSRRGTSRRRRASRSMRRRSSSSEALSHPSRDVRMIAQRGLTERDAGEVPRSGGLIDDRTAPPLARAHALWRWTRWRRSARRGRRHPSPPASAAPTLACGGRRCGSSGRAGTRRRDGVCSVGCTTTTPPSGSRPPPRSGASAAPTRCRHWWRRFGSRTTWAWYAGSRR